MTYLEQLLTENWKQKRIIILKRDNFCCTNCNSKKLLQVHHKKYIFGRMAWEYPDVLLVTLCSVCHQKIHDTTKIKFELDLSKNKPKSNKKNRKKKKPKNWFAQMSQKDIEIQKKYNAYNLKNKKQ